MKNFALLYRNLSFLVRKDGASRFCLIETLVLCCYSYETSRSRGGGRPRSYLSVDRSCVSVLVVEKKLAFWVIFLVSCGSTGGIVAGGLWIM